MRSRLAWRRSATAVGIYGSAAVGFLGTVVAARVLGKDAFGLLALVLASAGFFQLLLDLTADEAVVKYGIRYTTREEWGKLRRLFSLALRFKLCGAVLAALAIAALSPLADTLFGAGGLTTPLLVSALLPLVQAPEGIAASTLVVRGRYDLRAGFQLFSMLCRLVALVVGVQFGVTETVVALVAGQALATTGIGLASWRGVSHLLHTPSEPIGEDRGPVRTFVLHSSIGTGLVSLKSMLAPLLVGVVATPGQVGLFRMAQAPQQGFAVLTAPVRLILLTEQTHDYERGDLHRLTRLLRRYVGGATVLMALALPPCLWLMPWLVRTVLGSENAGATDAARLILLAAAVQVIWGWTKSFPVSIGRPNLRIVANGVELVVLIPLLLVLGARWGATGAAGAVLLSTGAWALCWVVLALRLRRDGLHRPPVPSVRPSGVLGP